MSTWQITRVFAGLMLLISLALGAPGSPLFQHLSWLWLSAFVGLNLMQSGFSRWCLMERLLRRFGLESDG